jgi:ABC-type phosphate transport system permease subunit
VPSVVYGLIGVLVLVPFVGNHLITASQKEAVAATTQLNGYSLLVAVVILTIMIAPIMIALMCEALAAVPGAWREGAIALGLNPLRAIMAVTVRAARPAIVAAVVLATARAVGEAIMISMVSGSRAGTPSLAHGPLTFLYSPIRTLASTIVDFREGISAPALGSSLYAFALLLLFGGLVLSVCGYLIKLPMRKYQLRG